MSRKEVDLMDMFYLNQKYYWGKKIGNVINSNQFFSMIKINNPTGDFEEINLILTPDTSNRIKSIGTDSLLQYIVLTTFIKIAIYHFTKENDCLILSPIYMPNKNEKTLSEWVIVKDHIQDDLTIKDMIIKNSVEDAYNNQDYPFENIVKKFNNIDSLIDVICAMHSIHDIELFSKIKNKILFIFDNSDDCITISVRFDCGLFDKYYVEKLVSCLNIAFNKGINSLNTKIGDFDLIDEFERRQILYQFNDTVADYPRNTTIHQLFEEQLKKTPDNIALVFEDFELSYRFLNYKADILANFLISKGVVPRDVIGLVIDRSVEMIIGMLGILKAGCAYLPIDDNLPVQRINYILNDANVSVVLTSSTIVNKTFSYSILQKNSNNIINDIIVTKTRSPIKDLDILPIPDRTYIDTRKYSKYIGHASVKNAISIHDSRGCPYNCAYCHRLWPKTYVSRSAENLFEEVKLYYNIGVRRFHFVNDAFNLNINNSGKFFKFVIDSGMKPQFYFPNGLRADRLTKEFIDLMVEAGTINLALALETASPRLQKLINKNLNLNKFNEIVNYITEKYPHVILELFIMHGFPTETEDEAMSSLDLLKQIKWVHFPYYHLLKIYPYTDMYKIAIDNGISSMAIERSLHTSFHDYSETLPFSKKFTKECQTTLLNDYILSKERLISVLPYQKLVFTEKELVDKYNSYLPFKVSSFSELLTFFEIENDEIKNSTFADDSIIELNPDFEQSINAFFPIKKPKKDAIKLLFIDLNLLFEDDTVEMEGTYDPIEVPLGPLYLATYLNKIFGDDFNGKVIKSRIDFKDFKELKSIVNEFMPDMICISCLSYYRDFFHKSIALLRQWGIVIPIIVGGPYPTSSYNSVLNDRNIDIVIFGEGEITLHELVEKFIENGKKIPDKKVLNNIEGIAFVADKTVHHLDKFNKNLIFLDHDISNLHSKKYVNNNSSSELDLAYIIYTSGTTGFPKGTMIEHKSVVNLLNWFCNNYGLESNRNVLSLTNISFDVSIEEIFATLISGAKLIISKKEIVYDPDRIIQFIIKNRINIAQFVPVTLMYLLNYDNITSLNKIICGGDKLDNSLKNEILSKGYQLYNNYGPTESTVDAIVSKCSNDIVLIGKPIHNINAYILDQCFKIQSVGVLGELMLGGVGLARGYLNHAELTAEKFIWWEPNTEKTYCEENKPKSAIRIYRTGDLCRWLPGGNIELLGRIDHQVKIRGFRIELGEIENQLLNIESIKEAVVIAKGDSLEQKYLIAYIVVKNEIDNTYIINRLSESLQDYMIPSHFIVLDKIPISSNGKIDRKSLPDPEIKFKKYVGPKNDIEIKMIEIWSDILGVDKDKISIDINFFEIGGHSLKATILMSKIHKIFDVKIQLAEIFKTPTVEGISILIELIKKRQYDSNFELIGERKKIKI